ncbi:SPOR domain-containing protein [Colwellia sp. TT2012]|uniref:SPOR domain-containing protein n=1 Tax=Colwellia sp. TT2012 TaxID=1720342 RepID=UPI00070FA672|nr:hypothetical protein [Colwellia sp. TT2012]
MSALENTSPTAPTLAENISLSANVPSAISVPTRIEHNLCYTKQAVLVIASNTEQYSQLASQYLVSLSNDHSTGKESHINVAFVSASTKLNDIQIRCRLIEQLFINTLFDPEQSLAVSVLRFAKQQGEAISIVIDHAHALSLQLKYELSQLVSLAKKDQLIINVVLFGLTEAAKQLSLNKSLFKHKMVVIEATSGQVLSLDDKRIHHEKATSSLTLWQKVSLLLVMLMLLAILIWGYQVITDTLNKQSNPLNKQLNKFHVSDTVLPAKNSIASVNERVVIKMAKKQKLVTADELIQVGSGGAASSEEINRAILALPVLSHAKQVPANASDVINALVNSFNNLTAVASPSIDVANKKAGSTVEKQVIIEQAEEKQIQPIRLAKIASHYYQNQAVVYEYGYVIQLAGFSDSKLWHEFIENHRSENLFSYQRLLTEQRFIVVTSRVYPNKTMAKSAIKLLPASLLIREPWLKDISLVISEINTFKG